MGVSVEEIRTVSGGVMKFCYPSGSMWPLERLKSVLRVKVYKRVTRVFFYQKYMYGLGKGSCQNFYSPWVSMVYFLGLDTHRGPPLCHLLRPWSSKKKGGVLGRR